MSELLSYDASNGGLHVGLGRDSTKSGPILSEVAGS